MTRAQETRTDARAADASRGAADARRDATEVRRDAAEVLRGEASPASPQVSVIVPAYNTARYVAEALDSVFAQTFRDFEVVVVNDGSPDTEELERVLAPYRERIVYIRQENRGSSGARNAGVRAARGRYVAMLDSDDVWETRYLEVMTAALEEDATLDVVYPNALIFGDSPQAGREFMDVFPFDGELTFASVLRQESLVFGLVTARRESLIDAGLYDEELGSAEDCDLWLRILARGGRIAYRRDVLARYRRRQGSHTSDPQWIYRNGLKWLDKVARTMELTAEDRAAVEKQRAHLRAMLRLHEGKKAFFAGDARGAVEGFTEANAVLRSRKLKLLTTLLRVAPRLMLRAYHLRDRFILRADTKF
ncbi:MAG TPA: glycosyltransferase family A protein [Pyrinomonadaceae bacterium]|nr:glycosyltransferase family A protein [Pyrinomonadaceae bacterium]